MCRRAQIKAGGQRQQRGRVGLGMFQGLGIFSFAQRGAGAQQSGVQAGCPVGQAGMVAGDHIGQNPGQARRLGAVGLLKNPQSVQRTGGGMRLLAALRQPAFDVGVGHLADVALKTRAVLAQVVPLARQTRKFRTPVLCEPRRQCRHLLQVIDQPMRCLLGRVLRVAVGPKLWLHGGFEGR